MEKTRYRKSYLAGLEFPVARIKTMLRSMKYAERVSDTSAVCLTAILEYITVELLEWSRSAAESVGSKRIQSKHVNMALRNDTDLSSSFKKNTVIAGAGVFGLKYSKFDSLPYG